tara:strand:+ start:4061 stop:4300 length:240 start_codon:yes stop_codon:yes gene_type:complete
MKTLKNKKTIAGIVSVLIALLVAIYQNGGLDGIIVNVPGSDPIEIEVPEACEGCEEDCECHIDDGDCNCGDGCSCPACI